MKVIFSRKGFDSSAGKAPSPIIDEEPVSIPIPTRTRSETTYDLVGLRKTVERITKGRIRGDHLCHEDPVFLNGRWVFGQTGAAQSHLEKNKVGVGYVFIFFGLFVSSEGRDRHHRIFGYLEVDEVRRLGGRPSKGDNPAELMRRHPHTIGEWNPNNTLYLGRGARARTAPPSLRLTKIGGPTSIWSVPAWIKEVGLTYHSNPARWLTQTELRVASRGQEFVADLGDRGEAKKWLRNLIADIEQ